LIGEKRKIKILLICLSTTAKEICRPFPHCTFKKYFAKIALLSAKTTVLFSKDELKIDFQLIVSYW
jgi:hypothetical protein